MSGCTRRLNGMTLSKRWTGAITASRQVVLREVECQATENSMLPVLPLGSDNLQPSANSDVEY